MYLDEPMNLIAKLFDTGKNSSMNSPSFQLGKPSFHRIQPRRAGGGEMEIKSRVLGNPLFDLGCLMCTGVI